MIQRKAFSQGTRACIGSDPEVQHENLLKDSNANVLREDIFKPAVGNESLHELNNDNGVRIVNFVTSENLIKSTMFPHRNIHKYTWTSPDKKAHSQIDHILKVKVKLCVTYKGSFTQVLL